LKDSNGHTAWGGREGAHLGTRRGKSYVNNVSLGVAIDTSDFGAVPGGPCPAIGSEVCRLGLPFLMQIVERLCLICRNGLSETGWQDQHRQDWKDPAWDVPQAADGHCKLWECEQRTRQEKGRG
jgi:hypothetical protein